MKFHRDGELAPPGHIWVFGSNLAGRHGAGAAKVALQKYRAMYGNSVGPQGNSYAIPTKDVVLKTLPLKEITPHIHEFLRCAREFPTMEFFVTSIGCGLAGYKPADIAPMFRGAPDNCSFPDTWKSFLEVA